MKAFAIGSVTAFLLVSTVAAQPGGDIKVYPDFAGNPDCNLVEQLFVVNNVWVVHEGITSASGAKFRVDHNWGAVVITPVFGEIIVPDPMDIYTGITILYPGCELLPFTIAQLPFLPAAATPPCTAEFHVVPDPSESTILARDCGGTWVEAGPGLSWVVVNKDETCECHADPPVDVKASNWSKIKALYR